MKRREFVKKISVASAASMVVPYILPSGRLFAATGSRKANHVVFCLFAGGLRNLESVHKANGNLMPNTLLGNESISLDILPGLSPLPTPTSTPLQTFGTLFKEFRYKKGPTGHFNGHTAAITGTYSHVELNFKERPQNPTVFEYYRKHSSAFSTSLDSWWVSNFLAPYPSLNYSKDKNYGPLYGGQYIQPHSLIDNKPRRNSFGAIDSYDNSKLFSSSEKETNRKNKIIKYNNSKKNILSSKYFSTIKGEPEAVRINNFLNTLLSEAENGVFEDPWNIATPMNSDMYNIFFAERIIKEFKPELMVINLQGADVGHSNFTQYCDNIRKADYALWHLWQTIQSTPGMANDTILIVAPDIGRNSSPNSIIDNFGRYGLDHTGDSSSREIFCLIVGPPSVVKQNLTINDVTGESIDIVPTIAHILGFYNEIPTHYKAQMGKILYQAFI